MGKIQKGQFWGKIKDILNFGQMVLSFLWRHLEGSVDMDIRASGGEAKLGCLQCRGGASQVVLSGKEPTCRCR